MEVDGGLRGSKLKAVTVGGLLQADGTVQHGYRGCLQVSTANGAPMLHNVLHNLCIMVPPLVVV